MIKLDEFWNKNENWRPLIASLTIIILIAITHKIYWETTAETDPAKIWEGQTFSVYDPGEGENQIVEEVLRKGYKLEDKLIRPAMVKVQSE